MSSERNPIHTVPSKDVLARLAENISTIVRGKDTSIRLCLTALLARGHLLIEDIPGVGKTTLARSLAASVDGSFKRIQFTSDMLPSDILGVSIFKTEKKEFEFRPGPIFSNIVLADEINRTTPRTQSALLEAMSEGKVSVDNITHGLPKPFMVIATQNPREHYGTYPLPESQMDRFLLRIRIGYPNPEQERQILRERKSVDPISELSAIITHETLSTLQDQVEKIKISDSLLDYVMRFIECTRDNNAITVGVSTRGAIAWYRAAQAWALLAGRDFCIPDDFKDLSIPTLAHRVQLAASHGAPSSSREKAEQAIATIAEQVVVPT